MAVADGTILRVVASLLFPDSVIAQNIFYAVFADTGTSDDDEDVVDDLEVWVEAIYNEIQGTVDAGVELGEMKVYFYDPIDDDWDELGTGTPSDTFAGAGQAAVNGVAALVHARTTDPDVSAHKYFGGINQTSLIENDIIGALATDLVDLAGDWVTPFVGATTGADFAPGVWSPTKGNFFLFNGDVVVNGQVAYQRRRKPGVGI